MFEKELYKRLREITKENEITNECPIMIYGIMCSTDGEWLDMENFENGALVYGDSELIEFVEKCGVSAEDLENAIEEIEEENREEARKARTLPE